MTIWQTDTECMSTWLIIIWPQVQQNWNARHGVVCGRLSCTKKMEQASPLHINFYLSKSNLFYILNYSMFVYWKESLQFCWREYSPVRRCTKADSGGMPARHLVFPADFLSYQSRGRSIAFYMSIYTHINIWKNYYLWNIYIRAVAVFCWRWRTWAPKEVNGRTAGEIPFY